MAIRKRPVTSNATVPLVVAGKSIPGEIKPTTGSTTLTGRSPTSVPM